MRPQAVIPERELLELVELCTSTPDGAIVEIGVYKGGSAYRLNEVARGRKLHLFDTFKGIPFVGSQDLIPLGAFSDTSKEAVQAALPEATIYEGLFPDTLPDDLVNLAFVHVDCDQQATCREAIERLWPRMVPGGIMAFDDYPFPGITYEVNKAFGALLKFTEAKMAYAVKGSDDPHD